MPEKIKIDGGSPPEKCTSGDLEWASEAQQILRALIARHGCSAKHLSRLLETVGVQIQPKALTNKINRGTFTFAFVLQVARALNVDSIDVSTLTGHE